MKLILEFDNDLRKYKYNLFTTFEYEDETLSPNARVAEDDDLEKFLNEIRNFINDH